ncbi:copper chaperone CopZ [Actinomycetospora corticicola]|uniref:Copper chaperone n=1 Tax=Actinomycetospora corticicola TaxID=663602 RepID=A0A7Y9E051_9PSEU|nr:cation transporter [Actinomycetospora corticicola]NYD38625.1 copper chaperone [Actinomycetospora corticicola]
MATTTLSVPEIHCDHCRAAIEGALSPIDGVEGIDVDLENRVVHVEHDDELQLGSVVEAIEDQGYDVPNRDAYVRAS